MEKIGFYCSSISWGGLEMNIVKCAVWLKERGYPVLVYCVKDSPIAESVLDKNLEHVFVPRNRKYFDFKNAWRMSKRAKSDEIKAMWLRDTRDLSTIGLAKTFSGKKFKMIYQQAMQLGVDKKDFLHTLRFARIDAWISLLDFLADQGKARTKFDSKKLHTVPLAVDIAEEKLDKAEARTKLQIEGEKFTLGIIGRYSPLKGQLFLIRELAKLRAEGKDIELLMVGEKTRNESDDYYNQIIAEIEELGLLKVVHMRPFMKNPTAFFKAIDLFIMASKGETFGTVTIESMMFGTPVLGTNASGTPELLEKGNLGYLFEVDNGEQLREQISRILENEQERKAKSEMAQKVAQEKYTRAAVTNRIEDLLETLDLKYLKQASK